MKEAEQNKDKNFAVLSAMLKAGMKPKPKLNPVEYARRLAVEKALQQRRYCDAFALWRTCPHKPCRRQRRCCGEAVGCLRRARARAASGAVAGAAGHPQGHAAQYRRAGARGTAMHAAGFV